jgi:SAM-dependent methyltransferase
VRATAYRLLWAAARFFHRAGRACAYAAAGLLQSDDLRRAGRMVWRHFGTGLIDVDSGFDGWERRMYDEALRPGDRILLAGCGAGRDLLALLERGHEVTGLDPTPELVDEARRHLVRRGMQAQVVQGFVETAHVDGPYDLIALGGNCYSFVMSAAARTALLARLKDHLAPGGRLLITFSGTRDRGPRAIRMTQAVGRVTGADWLAEPGDCFVEDFRWDRLVRYEHLFKPGEIERECAAAGLRVLKEVRQAGFYAIALPEGSATPDPEKLSGSSRAPQTS